MNFIITKNKGSIPLNNIWIGEFCTGKKCLEFKHSCYLNFKSEKEAKTFIQNKLSSLKEWIDKDIPKQAKSWGSEAENFIKKNKEVYQEISRAIHNLKIKKIIY
jgi:hypothetical protein